MFPLIAIISLSKSALFRYLFFKLISMAKLILLLLEFLTRIFNIRTSVLRLERSPPDVEEDRK